MGAETNILDFEGNTDLGESYASQLDWVVASIHRLGLPGLENPDVEKCTHLWSQIAKNPRVNIIAHSGDPLYAYDYEKVIPLFCLLYTSRSILTLFCLANILIALPRCLCGAIFAATNGRLLQIVC